MWWVVGLWWVEYGYVWVDTHGGLPMVQYIQLFKLGYMKNQTLNMIGIVLIYRLTDCFSLPFYDILHYETVDTVF